MFQSTCPPPLPEGSRGTGKSSFLEHIAEQFLLNGHSVLDQFSARDGENLGWLRNPLVKDKMSVSSKARTLMSSQTMVLRLFRLSPFPT